MSGAVSTAATPPLGASAAAAPTVAAALAEIVAAASAVVTTEPDASCIADAEDGHLPASDSDSTPPSVAFGTDFRRSVRTLGPVVASDVVATRLRPGC